jgi:hypothetical protein
MAKIQAEASRWGLEIEGEELACEACMAANTTFNVGGYSPVTLLFGVLPRGYLEPEELKNFFKEMTSLQMSQPSKCLYDFDKLLYKPAKPLSWNPGFLGPTGPDPNDYLWKTLSLGPPRWRFSEMMVQDMVGEGLLQSSRLTKLLEQRSSNFKDGPFCWTTTLTTSSRKLHAVPE